MKSRRSTFSTSTTYVHGTYIMSGGREITHLPSTLVRVTSDTGLTGWGEVCPLAQRTWLRMRAALEQRLNLAPPLLGSIQQTSPHQRVMDATPMGYAYAKSPIDVAGTSPARPGGKRRGYARRRAPGGSPISQSPSAHRRR